MKPNQLVDGEIYKFIDNSIILETTGNIFSEIENLYTFQKPNLTCESIFDIVFNEKNINNTPNESLKLEFNTNLLLLKHKTAIQTRVSNEHYHVAHKATVPIFLYKNKLYYIFLSHKYYKNKSTNEVFLPLRRIT